MRQPDPRHLQKQYGIPTVLKMEYIPSFRGFRIFILLLSLILRKVDQMVS